MKEVCSNYCRITSTIEQDLQSEMNIADRFFVNGKISNKEWNDRQTKAIEKYAKKRIEWFNKHNE